MNTWAKAVLFAVVMGAVVLPVSGYLGKRVARHGEPPPPVAADGSVQCEWGHVPSGGKCWPWHTERGPLGGCPTGYVDHPIKPDQCSLPLVAERIKQR